jgi:Tol biopolymer transport system component
MLVRFRLFASVLLAALSMAAIAGAAVPPGPRLAFVASHPYPNPGGEIATVGTDGALQLKLVGGSDASAVSPVDGAGPSWSADGSSFAFTGVDGGATTAVFVAAADGTHLHVVPASHKILFEGGPVVAPDGHSVAVLRIDVIAGQIERQARASAPKEEKLMVRFAIWSLDVKGGGMHRLTPWTRNSVLLPSSYSADGSALAATQFKRGSALPRAVSIDLASGRASVLAADAKEPVYAADGRVAVVRDHLDRRRPPRNGRALKSSDLLVVPAHGVATTRLIRVRGGLAWPSWDPSGQRLAFTKLNGDTLGTPLRSSNSIGEVNADGSCPTTLLSLKRGFFSGVSWQPGADRGAGPIACAG